LPVEKGRKWETARDAGTRREAAEEGEKTKENEVPLRQKKEIILE
jgi:hypothetical protein